MDLKFVEPVAKNGKELALVNEKDVASEFKRWENAVVAYFLGHDSTFGQPSFNKFINNLIDSEWRKYGNVKVYSKGSGVFVLDFESARGKELALSEGPRFYDGSKPFILKPWSRDMSLEINELKSAPIWIKLPNLRLHLWSPEALGKIASLVGRPLFADTVTASRETLCFARVCVEVDFEKILPDSITIEDDKGYSYDQKVEYEWQPTSRCSYCLHLGHSDSCPRRKTTFPCPFCLGQHTVLQILRLRQHPVQLLQCPVMKPRYLVQTFRPLCLVLLLLVLPVQRMMQGLVRLLQHKFQFTNLQAQ